MLLRSLKRTVSDLHCLLVFLGPCCNWLAKISFCWVSSWPWQHEHLFSTYSLFTFLLFENSLLSSRLAPQVPYLLTLPHLNAGASQPLKFVCDFIQTLPTDSPVLLITESHLCYTAHEGTTSYFLCLARTTKLRHNPKKLKRRHSWWLNTLQHR